MTLIVGLDTETTGLDVNKDRIIEIALVFHHLTNGHVGNYVKKINPGPGVAMNPKAQAVHGISLMDLKDAPSFADIASQLAYLMNKASVLITHNGHEFDLPLLVAEFHRAKVDLPDIKASVDTKEARWACPDGKYPRLGELCFALGVDYDEEQAHGAVYDASRTVLCYLEGKRRGFFQAEGVT